MVYTSSPPLLVATSWARVKCNSDSGEEVHFAEGDLALPNAAVTTAMFRAGSCTSCLIISSA